MTHLFFFNSPTPFAEVISTPESIADAVASGLGYQSDDEYLAITGLTLRILEGKKLSNTDWDLRLVGSLGLFDEKDDEGSPYTYVEFGLTQDSVTLLPPSMLARFDQEVAETVDDL